MAQGFEGFPKDLPDFLWGIAFHNEKAWFEARRDTYERVLHGPVKTLAADLTDALAQKHRDLPLAFHVSRIYRDARTLNGRGPLNDHMWFSIGKTARVYAAEPQFYFGVDARSCDWGVGLWNVNAADMERWRARIDADPARLTRIVRALDRKTDLALMGEPYKKPKGDPGQALYPWYNARRVVLGKTLWFEPDPPGPALFDTLLQDFDACVPLYRYLGELCVD